jgi:general L-amino acid transport system permease protein
MAARPEAVPVRPPLWRNVRFRRVVGQVLFVLVVLAVLREMYLNLEFGVRRQGIDLSFDFLRTQAGFPLKESVLSYSPADSTLRAFQAGVVNTLVVAGPGILLATVLGLVVGVARLSPNWLLRKLAQVYVEAVRNTPVLLQIIFWYSAVILTLPVIGGGSLAGVAFLSNRGAAVPWPVTGPGAGLWALVLLGALLVAGAVWRARTALNERTGRPHHRVLWSVWVFVGISGVGYVLLGGPVSIDAPELAGRRYTGGVQVSGEYAAVLLGLVVYTAAFIAEIVRGSILAVPKGQKEAAEALGLSPFQQLRFVVLPQALRIAIPPVNSQYLNLTKNSSLALAVAYPDVVAVGNTIINQKGRAFQVLALLMGTFLAASLFISVVMNVLNLLVTRRGTLR